MAVAGRIVALTVKLHVLGIGKRRRMQSMRRIKRHLHPKKIVLSSHASAKKSSRSCKRTRCTGIIEFDAFDRRIRPNSQLLSDVPLVR